MSFILNLLFYILSYYFYLFQNGHSALIHAIRNSQQEVVDLLLAAGADVEAKYDVFLIFFFFLLFFFFFNFLSYFLERKDSSYAVLFW